MDAETIGIISEAINSTFENGDILETVRWILESDNQVKSEEDLALGYFMGALMNVSRDILLEREVKIKRNDSWEKSLIKKYGKEKAKIMIKEITDGIEKARKESLSKGGRPLVVKLADQDIEKIRTLLIPMITPFREKIRHEDTLKNISKQKVAKK